MAEVQAQLQALSEAYQKLQQELQTAVDSRQKIEAQRQENLGVQKVSPPLCLSAYSFIHSFCLSFTRSFSRPKQFY